MRRGKLLTCAKYSGKGNPLSRANAHVSLDVEAKAPKQAKMSIEISAQTMAVVAPFDPVAVRNTWMMGNLVGLLRATITSPTPNKRAMENAIVNTPLIMSAMTML